MNFRTWLENQVSSDAEARRVLRVGRNASDEEVKDAYRRESKKNHPDRGGSHTAQQRVNSAFEFLTKRGTDSGFTEPFDFDDYWRRTGPNPPGFDIPPWQTDKRSMNNDVGGAFTNLNFCLKSIYEKATESGGVEKWTFWAFDGNYFRGVFTAYANEPTLG